MARTTTKAPAPKARLANPRNEALARMTKAELLKTVKTLDARVTKLLNQLTRAQGEITAYTSKPCTPVERATRGCKAQVTADDVVWMRRARVGSHVYYENGKQGDEGAVGFVPLSPQQPKNSRLLSTAELQARDREPVPPIGHARFPWET